MNRLSDEEWLARARARYGTFGEYVPEEVATLPPPAEAVEAQAPPAPGPCCPRCEERPALQIFPRRELVSYEPLRFCPQCYGFWARRDALTPGIAEPGELHPALAAAPAPARCRLCFGRLKPDGSCRDCEAPPEIIACPACDLPMSRFEEQGVTLDRCDGCGGLWFDMGEIVRVYGPAEPRSLASAYVQQLKREEDDEEPEQAWQIAATILIRLFLPFLPF